MKYILIMVVILAVIIFVFFIIKILPLLTAKPTVKHDYVSEYNKLTQPDNFDPNKNAAPYYQKAFDAFSEIPEFINKNIKIWPGDMNDSQLTELKTWLVENANTMDFLKQAVKKPYCWIERHGTDNFMSNIELSELSKIRTAAHMLSLQAKLYVIDGQEELAFTRITDIHRIGLHYSGPVTLVEQLVGIAANAIAFQTAFSILDHIEVESAVLADFQQQIEQQTQRSRPLNFAAGEKIYGFDITQRMFTDDDKGNGRLIPAKLYEYKKDSPITPSISFIRAVLICLNHPGRKETLRLYQTLYDELDTMIHRTPWQMQQDGSSYQAYVERLTKDNYFLNDNIKMLGLLCDLYHMKQALGDALITTIAILRYKADKGIFPVSSGELISGGYIKKMPMDPYSNKPLIYKKTDEDFILYSVGKDFKDDGGKPSQWGEGKQGGDQVFWPVNQF